MVRKGLVPDVHLFVCANRRADDSPLGRGCGDAGEQVFAAMKAEVARRGAFRTTWVTKTSCLGVCPKSGATVAVYPRGAVYSEVDEMDATGLLDAAVRGVLP
jgi:(2Fe-2S) ferredoxin